MSYIMNQYYERMPPSVHGHGGPVLVVEFVLPLSYLVKKSTLILVDEGGVSAEEDVQYHPDAPHVCRFVVRLPGDDLGRDVPLS